MSSTVLVTGPTGKLGRRLIPLLARRGVTIRPASRTPVPPRSGIEPVRFDWTDEDTYETARKGVDAIYVAARSIPSAEDAGYIGGLLDGAAEAGVARIVLLSTFGTEQAPPDNPLRIIELAVESSGVPYTILRPAGFMQNFSEWHPFELVKGIRERDEIAMPGGDGVVSWVSAEDIAAVAAVALTEDGHEGKAYNPVGPEALTLTEVAEHISVAVGRRIRYVETDHTPVRDALLAAGAPPETAEHNSQLYAFAMSSGVIGISNDHVLSVAGRPPVSFGEFAVGATAAWRR